MKPIIFQLEFTGQPTAIRDSDGAARKLTVEEFATELTTEFKRLSDETADSSVRVKVTRIT